MVIAGKETSGVRGVKYYQLSRSLIDSDIDEEDLNIPGQPGKFYTLYESICKNHKLRQKLEKALLKLDTDEGRKAIYKDVKVQYDNYMNMLAPNEENQKKFNRLGTGDLYKQQVDFFRIVLKNRPAMKEILKL